MDRRNGLARLSRSAKLAGLRLRLNAVGERFTTLAVFLLIYAVAALTAVKATRGAPIVRDLAGWGLFIPVTALVVGVLLAALRKSAPSEGALALDRHHSLSDRVTNALAFSGVPDSERTPLMDAAIDDGVAMADRLEPSRAVPLRRPQDAGIAALLALALAGVASLEVPGVRVEPPKAPPHLAALEIAPDDADLLRHVSEELLATTTDADAQAGARRFNQLVEDLAERRLDREEVFRRLDALDRSLQDPAGIDASALDEGLQGVARELAKSGLSKPVADALADKRLGDAEQAMRDLAKKIEGAKKDVDKAKLEELRKSLQRSSETVHNKGTDRDAERSSLEEQRRRLLQKKQKEGLTNAEQQELDRTERRLDRLSREKDRADAQSRSMSGLDKDLAQAAQDLMKDLGMGSKDLERGAEDINRASQRQMSEQQKQELRQRIEELRQMLRQEGQSGKDRLKRMMSFGQRAHGNQGSHSGQGGGQGNQGQGQEGKEGKDGKGQQGLSLGGGKPGSGSALVFGPGGMASGAGEPSPGAGTGSGQRSDEWGTGHDPNVRGDASQLKGKTEDVSAVGADTGQGAASSQVIYGAAQRGFTGSGYKKVFTDYRTVAEESLGKDEIPPGYRFYVRRYFELIRPRD
jgi:hypothetical protein